MTSHDVENKRISPRPLFEAGKLRCPHDKQTHDILTYKRFDLPREFETQLNVVLRCAFCSHVFSPHLNDDEMKFIEESF
jgi:hypothetical protein